MAADIKDISDLKTFLSYASQNLDWNIDTDDLNDIDDLTYEFDAGDIHLKPEEFAKVISLKQLRPFHEKQPWGIFALEFESRRFEITSLRKVLSGLVPRRRNRDHAVWDKKDLLFFCFWGEKSNRTFGVFHFEDKPRGLPQIKAFYCSPRYEDPSHLQVFEDKLQKLSWPSLPENPGPADFNEWRTLWAGPFTAVYRQTIRDSATLTTELAGIARNIQRRIIDIFAVETENGAIHELYEKFRKALIHDMTKEQFADMYAQTMVYGLFSARCMIKPIKPGEDSRFEPREAIDAIPSTNPFLQKLLKESFSKKNKLSFDELDLGDITLLLQNTDTDRILEDFNRQTGGGREDPVIYFYEGFLNAYEKEQKKRRGVYYTPQPVVKFMVRAVDDILKTEFGIQNGLASTATKTIRIPKKKDGKTAEAELQEVPAIQILDPAVGTGTFLRQIILQIWENFKSARPGVTQNAVKRQWNAYVKDNLLPRLNGFELMMAPYAVAHMKLAMCLNDTGYAFDEDREHPDRIKVFLTNSLEEADKEEGQGMMFEHDALTEESLEARKAKKNRGINVVIGNPPYSVESSNKGEWISILLEDYKKEPGGLEKLKERNQKSISDDYVKFIRYAQSCVERAGSGIVAFINNHSFLDNPTFRGMRWNLLKSFDKIYIIDLHGNTKKQETFPKNIIKDENVFDIQQGVSINILIKNGSKEDNKSSYVYNFDLYGKREDKYEFLRRNTFFSVNWNCLSLQSPQYFFVVKNFRNTEEYECGFRIQDLMPINSMGILTARDGFTIHETKEQVKNTICSFIRMDDELARISFNLDKDVRDWSISGAKKDLTNNPDFDKITKISYRPFDIRYTYYTGITKGFHCMPRGNVMRNFLADSNLGLCLIRINRDERCTVLITNYITDKTILSPKDNANVFPLYIYPDSSYSSKSKKSRRPNLDQKIVNDIANKLHLVFESEKSGGRDKFAPIDLLDYIYAVLHSPAYRETYREFLKIDFPRVPYPADRDSFWKLVSLGGELRQLHLLEGQAFGTIAPDPGAAGKVSVEKVRYDDGKVFVNDVFCFDNVPKTAWDFYIGGYQPAQKWLKDRKGRVLTGGDLAHYRKIIIALTESARVMGEIDKVGVV